MQVTRIDRMLLCALLLALMSLPALAAREDDADRKSKNGRTEGVIDEVKIAIEYGRPNVKGREIWGDLVSHGKVWRTGANEATAITFSADVKIGDQTLAAGTYSLFTIPGEEEWTVIFNTVAEQWGAYDYAEGKDALRVQAKPQAHEHVESLDFVIEGSSVMMRWEKLAVGFEVAGSH